MFFVHFYSKFKCFLCLDNFMNVYYLISNNFYFMISDFSNTDKHSTIVYKLLLSTQLYRHTWHRS